ADLVQLLLGAVPEVVGLVGEAERDLRHMRRGDQGGVGPDERFGAVRGQRHALGAGTRPPMRQTSSHSSSVTGWTESRIEVTSAILASLGLALTSFSVTGCGMSRTARMSTHSQRGSSVVESGCASA